MTRLKKAVSNRKRKLKKGSEMDKLEVIEEKIDLIKNEVESILEKYHAKGAEFTDVELILKNIEMHLMGAVKNYPENHDDVYHLEEDDGTEIDLEVDFYTYNSMEQVSLDFKTSGGTTLSVDVVMSDLLEGYNWKNVDDYNAFTVDIRGSFWLNSNGWYM